MILIKGKDVKCEMADGSMFHPPASYGIIHDPSGAQLPKCAVFFGPYRKSSKKADLTGDAKAYFGPDYDGKIAQINVPDGPWHPMGDAVQIFYRRPGKYAAKYFHVFDKRVPVLLSRCKDHFRLDLKSGCTINWRGFVSP